MTITIDLPPEAEQRLLERAASGGVSPAEVAAELIRDGLDSSSRSAGEPNPNQATLDMLARWADEDAAEEPVDPAEARRDWEEFRDAMNAHSTRGHPIYP